MSDKYYWLWREEKKKRQEAEGETTIVKGIGMNSPEMIELQKRVKELEEIEKSHKELNGKLREELENRVKELDNSLSIALDINDKFQREVKEVKEDNKKLAVQINDLEKKVRRIK